jgi:hypothetical protein
VAEADEQESGNVGPEEANPSSAPAVFIQLWKRGGAAPAGVATWLMALVVAVTVGVLIGVATNHHIENRHIFGSIAVGVGVLAFCLVLFGGYLTYRGTGGYPRGWAVDEQPRRPRMPPRPLRTWWIWTIVANFAGIIILLIGWGTNSSPLLDLGFIVLVVSLGVRVATQLRSRTNR